MKPDTTINLGVFQFANHEIPERVSWGGSQRIAVHELVGGQRMLDAMGRSDRALTWSGLSGRALRMPTAAHGRAADVGKHEVFASCGSTTALATGCITDRMATH